LAIIGGNVAFKGVRYGINGTRLPSPDEESWTPIAVGEGLDGRQKRSPFMLVEWLMNVAGPNHMDWFQYDNQVLESWTGRVRKEVDEYDTFTDAVCVSVVSRHRRSVSSQIVATFKVNAESGIAP